MIPTIQTEKEGIIKIVPKNKRTAFPAFMQLEVRGGCVYGSGYVIGQVPDDAVMISQTKWEIRFESDKWKAAAIALQEKRKTFKKYPNEKRLHNRQR